MVIEKDLQVPGRAGASGEEKREEGLVFPLEVRQESGELSVGRVKDHGMPAIA